MRFPDPPLRVKLAGISELPSTTLDQPVVVLTDDPEAAADALRRGAAGVVTNDGDPERLAFAMQAAAHGFRVIDQDLASGVDGLQVREPEPGLLPLTRREQDVLDLMAEGLTNADVATALGTSVHTVRFHVRAILEKLGAATRTEAVVRALRSGLIYL